ncbi:MAG TPA: TolC family protein [Candidatus Limnocylindrales bacterium]|nr:TolC family protein [Candidatus Limnocylindrales bacterium]
MSISNRLSLQRSRCLAKGLVIASALAAAGCALTPKDLPHEQDRLAAAGVAFEPPIEQRELPVPRDAHDWGALVHRALLANGELEAAYFEWKAAVEKVTGDSGWPDTNLAVGYETMFEGPGAFSAGFDAMENLSFPTKTMKAGQVALEEARAAAEKFRGAKFALQKRVLDAWLEMVLAAERERIQSQRREVAGLSSIAGSVSVTAGEPETAALQGRLEETRMRNELVTLGSDVRRARAMLAAIVALDTEDIAVPSHLPSPRPVPSDAVLLASGARTNPELAELLAMLQARSKQVDLARMQWIPDVQPSFSFEDLAVEVLGLMATLPTTIVEIRSSIAQAAALRSSTAAKIRQTELDRTGEFVAALIALRNAERSRAFLENQVLPVANALVASTRTTYVSGQAALNDLVEAHEAVLLARDEIAAAAVERERRVAELEALAGVDMEAIVAGEVVAVGAAGGARDGAARLAGGATGGASGRAARLAGGLSDEGAAESLAEGAVR